MKPAQPLCHLPVVQRPGRGGDEPLCLDLPQFQAGQGDPLSHRLARRQETRRRHGGHPNLNGQEFVGLNGGTFFTLSEAVSFQILCETQGEIDYYWDALLADGGQPGPCGWLKDRFGVSWQVTPAMLTRTLESGDVAKATRVTEAFMKMGKMDIATLEKAAAG